MDQFDNEKSRPVGETLLGGFFSATYGSESADGKLSSCSAFGGRLDGRRISRAET
jgi:hypothetical protein